MLPEFYQEIMSKVLSKAENLLIQIVINVLQSSHQVSLEKIATYLPIPICFESRRKKMQRLLSSKNLSIEKLWLPLIKAWLSRKYSEQQRIYVAIDRTQVGKCNILMLSIINDGRAIPLYWQVLAHQGNSNLVEQKGILEIVLPVLQAYQSVILGDREFCSVELANWLRKSGIDYCLRLRRNEYVEVESQLWQQLNDIGLAPGTAIYLRGVKVTKAHALPDCHLACRWLRSYAGTAKQPWFILSSFTNFNAAILAYQRRFNIEEMFRDFKRGGYNLHSTNVTGARLVNTILLVAIAYLAATLAGVKIKRSGIQAYFARPKEPHRFYRRHSSFSVGFHAFVWLDLFDASYHLVQQLLALSPSKLLFYQRGLKAISLALSAF